MSNTVRQQVCEGQRRALVRLVRAGVAWSAFCLACRRPIIEEVGVTVCPVCGGPLRAWGDQCQ